MKFNEAYDRRRKAEIKALRELATEVGLGLRVSNCRYLFENGKPIAIAKHTWYTFKDGDKAVFRTGQIPAALRFLEQWQDEQNHPT